MVTMATGAHAHVHVYMVYDKYSVRSSSTILTANPKHKAAEGGGGGAIPLPAQVNVRQSSKKQMEPLAEVPIALRARVGVYVRY